MSVLLRLIYRFSTILINISVSFFVEIGKLILNFIWKHKGPRIAKEKQNKIKERKNSYKRRLKFQDSTSRLTRKLHESRQCGIVLRTDRSREQKWCRTTDFFTKVRRIFSGKTCYFQQMALVQLDIHIWNNELQSNTFHHINTNSKWVRGKCKT